MAAKKKSAARKSSSKKTASRKSASKKKSARSGGAPDALTLLRTDHQNVSKMFDQFEKTRSSDRKKALAEQICNELTVHAQIEEEIFYPAARGAIRDKDLIAEATVEHQSAKDLIAQIEGGRSGEMWEAQVKVLGEYIKHHVKEEQNELFAQVRRTKLDTRALGEQMQARKMELMGESGGGGGDSEGLMSRMARGIGLSSGT
jgi:hemerythrin-like domain-containing protein